MSSGLPTRGVRWCRNIILSIPDFEMASAVAGETIRPGEIALHRMFSLPCCSDVLSQRHDGSLGHPVCALREHARVRRSRCGVDDRTAATCPHVRNRILATEHGAACVDTHDRIPYFYRNLFYRRILRCRHAGVGSVVVQNVQSTKTLHGELDHALDGGGITHVDCNRVRFLTLSASRFYKLLRSLEIDVREYDLGAFCRKRLRGSGTDSRARARHDGHFVFDAIHCCTPN